MIRFFAAGKPETKGSAKGFVVKGRAVITNANPRAKTWAGIVTTQAMDAMGGGEPMRCPVELHLTFTLPRPKGHYGTGKRCSVLRPDAPNVHSGRPDLDKLVRCLKDALTGVVYADDGQVWRVEASKEYGDRIGANVVAYPVPPKEPA